MFTVHIIHFSSKPGGIEVLMPRIIEEMSDINFRVFILRPHPLEYPNVYQSSQVRIYYGHRNIVKTYFLLWKYARKFRSDIFHGFNIGPFNLLVLRLAGIRRFVYSIRGTVYWRTKKQKLIRALAWRIAVRKSYSFISNSDYSKKCFQETITKKKEIKVIYNPIASERIEFNSKDPNSIPKRIIYCGRLVNGKNLFHWIDVAVEIHKINPEIVFELFGKGYLEKELREYSKENNMEKNIRFMGFEHDVKKIYHNADILLFLSQRESFGNVVVEGILSGTPVITSSIPSMQEIFRNYPIFLVPLNDNTKKLVVTKVQDFNQLIQQTNEAAQEFSSRFSMNNYIYQIASVYHTML